jgi:GT2 family glycosyltransferase
MLGIVILNYNTWEVTVKCVESVVKTCLLPCKIYIVDNYSNNNSYDNLSKTYSSHSNVIVIKNDVNGGFAKGNNIGIRAGIRDGCEYLLVTNNDIIFLDSCIYQLYSFIHNMPTTVIVGPKIYNSIGKIQVSSMTRPNTYWEYVGFHAFSNSWNLNEENITEATEVYSVSGCCFIIRSKEFVEIGAFDENTFLYNEESILSFQANQSNYNTYFLPSAAVIHEHGATAGKQSLFINSEFLKSGLYYWKKYRKINTLQLIVMWIFLTSRTMIKSLYCKDLQKGCRRYLQEACSTLWREMIS